MLTASEVARLLGLKPRTVYALGLPCYRFGRAVRFDPADVEAYRASCRSAGTPATSAGATNSTATFKAAATDLAACFPRGWSQAQADAYDRTEGARNASCWEDSPAHFHPPGATTARSTASAWRTSSSVMSRQAEARGWIWRIPISGT